MSENPCREYVAAIVRLLSYFWRIFIIDVVYVKTVSCLLEFEKSIAIYRWENDLFTSNVWQVFIFVAKCCDVRPTNCSMVDVWRLPSGFSWTLCITSDNNMTLRWMTINVVASICREIGIQIVWIRFIQLLLNQFPNQKTVYITNSRWVECQCHMPFASVEPLTKTVQLEIQNR